MWIRDGALAVLALATALALAALESEGLLVSPGIGHGTVAVTLRDSVDLQDLVAGHCARMLGVTLAVAAALVTLAVEAALGLGSSLGWHQ